MYIKTENLSFNPPGGSLTAVLTVSDSVGGNQVYSCTNGYFEGTYDYTPIDILYELQPGATSLMFTLNWSSGMNSGTVYVDDVSIEAVTDVEAARTDIPNCQVVRDAKETPRLQINGEKTPPTDFLRQFIQCHRF